MQPDIRKTSPGALALPTAAVGHLIHDASVPASTARMLMGTGRYFRDHFGWMNIRQLFWCQGTQGIRVFDRQRVRGPLKAQKRYYSSWLVVSTPLKNISHFG